MITLAALSGPSRGPHLGPSWSPFGALRGALENPKKNTGGPEGGPKRAPGVKYHRGVGWYLIRGPSRGPLGTFLKPSWKPPGALDNPDMAPRGPRECPEKAPGIGYRRGAGWYLIPGPFWGPLGTFLEPSRGSPGVPPKLSDAPYKTPKTIPQDPPRKPCRSTLREDLEGRPDGGSETGPRGITSKTTCF